MIQFIGKERERERGHSYDLTKGEGHHSSVTERKGKLTAKHIK